MAIQKDSYVYLMSNQKNGTIYTGVTSDIVRRVYQHKEGGVEGFTKKYHIKNLVHYEIYNDISYAIEREKQIKAGSRNKKLKLIESTNPGWKDLYDDII